MIVPINPTYPIVDDNGVAFSPFALFLLQVSESSLIIGDGTPENNVEAKQGRFYMDESGTTGSIIYVKKTDDISGDRKQGWILI